MCVEVDGMLTKEEFGNKLKAAMDSKGMRQAALAESVGTSAANISNYVLGKAFPPVDILVEIANKLGISLDWLCGTQNGTDNHSDFQTMGDVANAILSISKNSLIGGKICTSHIEKKVFSSFNEYPTLVEEDVPAIAFPEGEMRTFIEDLLKMRKLLEEKTFDDAFYKRWLDDRIQSLNQISAEEDWELPFL